VPTVTLPTLRDAVRSPMFFAYAVTVGPLLYLTIRVIAAGWYPEGDAAVIGLKTLGIADGHPPLLGQWTTGSGVAQLDVPHHPGPLYYYLLAPIMLLTGGAAWGLVLASAAVIIALVVLTLDQTRRMSGPKVAIVVALGLLYFIAGNGARLVTPWNPWPMAFGLPVAVLLTIRLIRRDWSALPLWLFVIAIVVQSHASGVYPAAALSLFVGWVLVREVAGDRVFPVTGAVSRVPARIGLVALGVTFLCWLPVLIEAFAHSPNNLDAMLTYATSGNIPRLGWPRATEAISSLLGAGLADAVLPLFMGFDNYLHWTSGSTGAPFLPRLVVFLLRPAGLTALAAIGLAGAAVWRQGWTLPRARTDRVVPVMVGTVALLASVFSLAQADTSGPAGPFRVFYNTVSAPVLILLLGLVVHALVPLVRQRWPKRAATVARVSRKRWAKAVPVVLALVMVGAVLAAVPLPPTGVRGDQLAALTKEATAGESSVRIVATPQSDFALAPIVYYLRSSGKDYFFEPHFLWYDSDFAAHATTSRQSGLPGIAVVSSFEKTPVSVPPGAWTQVGTVPRDRIFELPPGATTIYRGK
jgi:hypothetical protein